MASPAGDDIKEKVYKLSIGAFVLERAGQYEKAIDIHKSAIEVLDVTAKTLKKSSAVRKIYRKLFERQLELHRERLAQLQALRDKGSFDGIILPPSALDMKEELAREDNDTSPWTLSQV